MNRSSPAAENADPSRRAFRQAPAGRLRFWRWMLLPALLLAAATLGDPSVSVVKAQEPTPQGEITSLAASSPEPGSLRVTWDLPDPEPSDYRVVWHKVGEPAPSWRDADQNAYTSFETYTIAGLQEDAHYRVLVRARYLPPKHRSPWSGPFADTTAKVSYGHPAKPANLNVSSVTHSQATVRWDAPENSKVTGYRLERATDGEATLDANLGPLPTEYTDTGLSPETTYTFTVTALNDLGAGAASEPAIVTTEAPAVDPDLPAPTGLDSSLFDYEDVVLTWDEPEGPSADRITGYRILRGGSAEDLQVLVRDTGSTDASWTDRSAAAGTAYVYAVRSRTANTMSGLSETLTVDTLAAPRHLNGHGTSAGVLLDWSAPDEQVTGYRVLRGPDADSLQVLVDDTGSAEAVYLDDAVAPETAYFYAVQALYPHGAGPVSAVVEIVSAALPPPSIIMIDPEPAGGSSEQSTAQQQDEGVTLASNAAQIDPGNYHLAGYQTVGSTNLYRAYATSFATGGDAGWFELTSVEFGIGQTDGRRLARVAIYASANGTDPVTNASFDQPTGEALSVAYRYVENSQTSAVYFTAYLPEGTVLDPGTTYWVVIEEVSGIGDLRLARANSASQLAGGLNIGDRHVYRDSLSQHPGSWRIGTAAPLVLTIRGHKVEESILVSAAGEAENDPDVFLRFGKEVVNRHWVSLPEGRRYDGGASEDSEDTDLVCDPAFVPDSRTQTEIDNGVPLRTSFRLCDLDPGLHHEQDWSGGRHFTTGSNLTGYTVTALGVDIDHQEGAVNPTAGIYAAAPDRGGSLDRTGEALAEYRSASGATVTAGDIDRFSPVTEGQKLALDPGTTYIAYFDNGSASGRYHTPNAALGITESHPGWELGRRHVGEGWDLPYGLGRDDWGVGDGPRLIPLVVYGWPNKPTTSPQQPDFPAPGPVLVSNLGHDSDGDVSSFGNLGAAATDAAIALSFRTGNHGDGYVLQGAHALVRSFSSGFRGAVKAAVHDDDDGAPGAALHTLGVRAGPREGVLTFHAKPNLTLASNKTYWLVIDIDHAPDDASFRLSGTLSPGEDSCTERGWSLGDTFLYRPNASSGWTGQGIEPDVVPQVAILGGPVTTGSLPLHEPVCGDLSADISTEGRLQVDGLGARTTISSLDDADWFSVELESGVDYQFDQISWRRHERPPQPWEERWWAGYALRAGYKEFHSTISLYDSTGAAVPGHGEKTRIVIRPTVTGTYYVGLEDPVWRDRPDFTNAVLVRNDDYPADATTTATVAVGGLKENYLMEISGADTDVDWIKVELEAGVQYQFTYNVGWCVHEAMIEGIYDADGSLISGTESSGKCWTHLFFTPEADGDYFVALTSRGSLFSGKPRYPFLGTHGTLYVWSETQGPAPEPEAGDLPAADVFTRGHVPNDERPSNGRLDPSDDGDWFSVWLDEGRTYRIVLDATPLPGEEPNDLAGNLRLNLNPLRGGLGPDTTVLNPKVRASAPAGSACVEITYTPAEGESGVHWLAVSAIGNATGDYRLIVSKVYTSDEVPGGDIPSGRSSIVTAAPGVPATGEIETANDRDWFRMPLLNPDRVYLIEVLGAEARVDTVSGPGLGVTTVGGTLPHTEILGVYDAAGNLDRYSGTFGDLDTMSPTGLTRRNAAIQFTPPSKGTYFLEVTGHEGGTGTYTVLVRDITDRTVSEGSIDFWYWGDDEGFVKMLGRLSPGLPGTGRAQGIVDDKSEQWRLNVEPGRVYRLTLTYSQSEAQVREFYLVPSATSPPGYASQGTELEPGVELVQNFDVGYDGEQGRATIVFEFKAEAARDFGTFGAETPVVWTVSVGMLADWPAPYTVLLTDITDSRDDYLGWETTTGTVEVGGSAAGRIDVDHDIDWFKVLLAARSTYRIKLRGTESSGGTLADPYLRLPLETVLSFDDNASRTPENDDKSATEKDSELTYTTFSNCQVVFIEAGAGGATGKGTGTYTLEVEEVSSPEGEQNCPATGQPRIRGSLELGETLSVDTSEIVDLDGLSGASFSYQWIRHDLATETDTDIEGETGATYTVTAEDVLNGLKVQVTFTDDKGFDESLTSPLFPPGTSQSVGSQLAVNTPATGVPGITRDDRTLTVDTSDIADDDGLTNPQFSYQWIRHDLDSRTDTDIAGETGPAYPLTAEDTGNAIKVTVTFTDDAGNRESLTSYPVAVAPTILEQQENSPATGEPYVTGTAQVGRTLIVDIYDIADEDGLTNAAYSYQWVRRDLATATDADIEGETGETYAVTAADEGKAIRVRVTFTDDAGNEESLLSAATEAVTGETSQDQADPENSPPTGGPTVSGAPQVGEVLTADTSGISDADGLSNASFGYQWLADDADIAAATGPTYTVAPEDEGKVIRVRVTFTDDAGNEETLTSEGTAPVTAAPEPELALSDLDVGAGQELLAAALIKAGDRGRKNDETQDRAWYATDTPAWHASGELRDGSLTWSGMTLTRVAYFPHTRALRFNQADADFHLGDSFVEGGVNHDLTIWVKTESGTVSFLARDHILSSGAGWINFEVPEAAKPVLDAIARDDLIIVAVSAPDTS